MVPYDRFTAVLDAGTLVPMVRTGIRSVSRGEPVP